MRRLNLELLTDSDEYEETRKKEENELKYEI